MTRDEFISRHRLEFKGMLYEFLVAKVSGGFVAVKSEEFGRRIEQWLGRLWDHNNPPATTPAERLKANGTATTHEGNGNGIKDTRTEPPRSNGHGGRAVQ